MPPVASLFWEGGREGKGREGGGGKGVEGGGSRDHGGGIVNKLHE